MSLLAITLLSLASAIPTNAFKLLVASNGPKWGELGAVQILQSSSNSSALDIIHTNTDCGAIPTWLDITLDGGRFTCADEFNPVGGLAMLRLNPDDTITKLSNISALAGPVSSAFFNDKKAVALAHVCGIQSSQNVIIYTN
jgi:hypothetical protein